jgi:hypothetical protein
LFHPWLKMTSSSLTQLKTHGLLSLMSLCLAVAQVPQRVLLGRSIRAVPQVIAGRSCFHLPVRSQSHHGMLRPYLLSLASLHPIAAMVGYTPTPNPRYIPRPMVWSSGVIPFLQVIPRSLQVASYALCITRSCHRSRFWSCRGFTRRVRDSNGMCC